MKSRNRGGGGDLGLINSAGLDIIPVFTKQGGLGKIHCIYMYIIYIIIWVFLYRTLYLPVAVRIGPSRQAREDTDGRGSDISFCGAGPRMICADWVYILSPHCR